MQPSSDKPEAPSAKTVSEKVPLWQRIVCAVIAMFALLGLLIQLINGLEVGLFRTFLALSGVFFFAHIAIKGKLPWWLFNINKIT